MTQRIHSLSKWQALDDGKAVDFVLDKARTVVLEVNAPQEVALYVQEKEAKPQFLALVKGRERIEFGVERAFKVVADGGPVWLYTFDGQETAFVIENPYIFTRIADRKQRNPHQELVEYQMRENIRRMGEQLKAESERRLLEVEQKLRKAYAPKRDQRAFAELAGSASAELEGNTASGTAAADRSSPGGTSSDVRKSGGKGKAQSGD